MNKKTRNVKKEKVIKTKNPTWVKLENFVYQMIDPLSGGAYRAIAQEELSQEELFQKWYSVYILCNTARPKKGTIHFLCIP